MTQHKRTGQTRSRTNAPSHHHPTRVTPTTNNNNLSRFYPLARYALLCLLLFGAAAIPFSLGKYIEFNSPGAFDSGAYVYSAWHVHQGAQLGVDEKPSAQLGTLLVNMLGVYLTNEFSETGPKTIQLLMQAAALILMGLTLKRLLGTLPAALAVFLAATYLSAPCLAKFGNVKEQYMIAVMIAAVCCFIFGQISARHRGWITYTLLAGALLVWAPLFKPTGVSAIAAVGLFTLAQPLLKLRHWKTMPADLALLLAGAALSMAPVFIWMEAADVKMPRPYSFVTQVLPTLGIQSKNKTSRPTQPTTSQISNPQLINTADTATTASPNQKQKKPQSSDYIAASRRYMSFAQQTPKVFRFYKLLILPIALALIAIATGLFHAIKRKWHRKKTAPEPLDAERFLPLLAIWWLLDMAFVWISPRSYEQYYLPLNASAAMLAAFPLALLLKKTLHPKPRPAYILAAIACLLPMTAAITPIFAGIKVSPHTGNTYTRKGVPEKRNGYKQRLQEIKLRKTRHRPPPWETTADYIRQHSTPQDKIYVWGWYPGIYVKAQRLSPTATAFESEMHTSTPDALARRVKRLLKDLQADPPAFMVDSRKPQFPWDRPPLELWPYIKGKGFLPNQPAQIAAYDRAYKKALHKDVEPAEAERYQVMAPLREFIRQNYRIVQPYNKFWSHVLLQRTTLNSPPRPAPTP